MDDFIARFALGHLAPQAPVLLTYVAGLVLAIVYWSRYQRPCAFTLAAVIVLLVTSIGHSLFIDYLFQMRLDQRTETNRFQWLNNVGYFVATFLRASGFGLLLTAVFVGRKEPEQHGTELSADDLV